jgi:hypothetical protein
MPRIAGYAAYAPPGSEDFFYRTLPSAIGLIDACLPNFGDCLLRTIEEVLARGHGSAVVLNSDSPTLPTALLWRPRMRWRSQASAPCSVPRATVAIICSG